MPNPTVEEFAKMLVEQVRDAAIQSSDRRINVALGTLVSGRAEEKGSLVQRWANAAADGNLKSIAAVLIPDIIDDTIFHVLRAIDEERFDCFFKGSNGAVVHLPKDASDEMGGSYMGEWRYCYSKERVMDDYSDLNLDFDQPDPGEQEA